MEQGKDLFLTRRFWGVVVAAAGPLLTRYLGIMPEGFEQLIDALVVFAGAAVTVWGHVKRDRNRPVTTVGGVQVREAPKLLALIVPLLFLVGCGTMGTAFGVPAKGPQTPQEYINEANILLTAVAKTVGDNVRAGTMTAAERDKIIAEVETYAKQVDDAQALLDVGKGVDAQQRAQIVHAAVKALHKKVAAKARGATLYERLRDRGWDLVAAGGWGVDRGSARSLGSRTGQGHAGVRSAGPVAAVA